MPDKPVPTLFGVALNRLVAFLGPYIAVLSGVVADWLTVHVHLLSTFHVGPDSTAKAVAQIVVFAITTAVVYAGQLAWLDGFQKWAYGIEQRIEHTDLPSSYGKKPSTVTGQRAEAAEGFGAGEPPVSG